MHWNDAILQHPDLTPTEKLLYHLLRDLGPDSPQVRARIACMLGLTERHMRRVGVKLAGIGEVDTPQPEPSNLGNPHPGPANVDNQHMGHPNVNNHRTCTSTPDTHVRPRTPVSAPQTPVRTLWSSSSEEDVRTKPLREPPTPQGGAGGSDPDPEYLTRLKHLWDQIDLGCTTYPESWFGRLHQEFGTERPLSVLQRFVLAEQTLADLDHPHRYKAYFGRWCRREHEEEAALLSDAASLLPGCDTGAAGDTNPLHTEEPVHADQPGLMATRGPAHADERGLLTTDEPVPVGNSRVPGTGDGSLPAGRATESPRARGPQAPAPGAAPSYAPSPLPAHGPMAARHPVGPYPGRPRRSPFKGWSTRWPPEAYRQSIRGAYEARRAQAASARA